MRTDQYTRNLSLNLSTFEIKDQLLYFMKPSRLSHFQAIFMAVMTLFVLENASANKYFDESEVKARLEGLHNDVIKPRYEPAVRSYIRTYVEYNRSKAQEIIGRTVMYFPLFEKHLAENNLSSDLKYLAIVESALHPKATSRAGAVGLWQFMPATAREYGMTVNDLVDERCDPNKSTAAAMKYLMNSYKRFQNWELVLASYNSGSGRVSRAIKRARSSSFSSIQKYLPRETRTYVPAFIAAAYLMQYYDAHELEPVFPHLDLQLTETAQVYSEVSFYLMAQITGLPLDVIELLNPAFVQSVVPSNPEGYTVTLPKRVMPAFREYLKSLQPDSRIVYTPPSEPVYFTATPDYEPNKNYFKSMYIVQQGETLDELARDFGCTVYQLMAWNNMKGRGISKGQQLVLYHPKNFVNPAAESAPAPAAPVAKKVIQVKPLPVEPMQPVIPETIAPQRAVIELNQIKTMGVAGSFLYYSPKQAMSLKEIAKLFPGITVKDLEKLNGWKPNQEVPPGRSVKIRPVSLEK